MRRFDYEIPEDARPIFVNGNQTSLEEMRHHAQETSKRAHDDGDYISGGMADCILALIDRIDSLESMIFDGQQAE